MQTNGTLATVDNRFNQLVARIHALPVPSSFQQWLLSRGVGLVIPYLSTSAVEFESVSAGEATLRLRNQRRVQNHMRTVHGAAMFLLAEAASGSVLSANLPDGARFATTHIEGDYVQRADGSLRAIARLNEDQQRAIRSEPKGKIRVPVVLTDAKGKEPANFVIEWSWKHPAGSRAAG